MYKILQIYDYVLKMKENVKRIRDFLKSNCTFRYLNFSPINVLVEANSVITFTFTNTYRRFFIRTLISKSLTLFSLMQFEVTVLIKCVHLKPSQLSGKASGVILIKKHILGKNDSFKQFQDHKNESKKIISNFNANCSVE